MSAQHIQLVVWRPRTHRGFCRGLVFVSASLAHRQLGFCGTALVAILFSGGCLHMDLPVYPWNLVYVSEDIGIRSDLGPSTVISYQVAFLHRFWDIPLSVRFL